jgi:ACR3 family arsenite efflux pump ArsB
VPVSAETAREIQPSTESNASLTLSNGNGNTACTSPSDFTEANIACLILILFLIFPRIALVLMFSLSNYLERAYHGLLIPLLGFILLPLTTLVYAWLVNTGQPIAGVNAVILIVAVIVDLFGWGGGEYHRRVRRVRRVGYVK